MGAPVVMTPAPNDDVTLGELARNIASLKDHFNGKFAEINGRFDSMRFVPKDVYDLHNQQQDKRINDLEERNKWLARAVVAAILFPFLAAVAAGLVVNR